MGNKAEERERKEKLEAHKKSQKTAKGKGVSGLGNTEEAKGDYAQTAKHTALNVGAGIAGGMIGIAVGKPSFFGGLAVTSLGIFFNIPALATAGTGMLVGSMAGNNLTKEQQQELDKTHPLKEGEAYNMEREQGRASFAVKNAIASLKNATYLLAEKKKDEPPKDASATKEGEKGTTGFGRVPGYQKQAVEENTGVEFSF